MRSYDHKSIEEKWQKRWEEQGLYKTKDSEKGKKNYYLLVEYPYPSGNLHIGHWYAFAVPDIFARYLRMRGHNVLFPIGFDSFGLPAENAAIKRKLDPKEWTYNNISDMTKQIRSIGNSFDWSRLVKTSDPDYYKWTQWLFLQLYKNGLVYRDEAEVNWCPSCKTVLANEQVIDERCERCDSEVERKRLKQWFVKITDYADRLLKDLERLDWPEQIKESQRNWIGRHEGAELEFQVKDSNSQKIKIFTTRPDTLYGATYMVLSPEHPLVHEFKERIENWDEVHEYIDKALKKNEIERTTEEKEKTGVELRGIKAINPGSKEEIPIFIADYVLYHYGTGAIMAVPAHDERDLQFAQKYEVPIKEVVSGDNAGEGSYTEPGIIKNSGKFDGLDSEKAKERITKHVGGKITATYRLRDWLISRQRYWGCPIPMVYDPEGNPHTVPDEYLPWALPEDVDFTPTGEAPLARSKELAERTEKIFGKGWKPEVDTMDTFVDSSWYFLRYLDPKNSKEFSSPAKQKKWMPVNRYSGGAEHTTMHVLYSRFFYKALYDLKLVSHKEPYTQRMNRGIILGPDGQKMSKSKGNVIDPDTQVKNVGADAVKMYLAFIGPYSEVGAYPWDLGGIVGIRRFLERVWGVFVQLEDGRGTAKAVERELQKTIKKVGGDIEAFKFNTAISQMMILINTVEKNRNEISKSDFEIFLHLLSVFAPHLSEEMWEKLGHENSIHLEVWPYYDNTLIAEQEVIVAVQINGKTRACFGAPLHLSKEEALRRALSLPAISKRVEGEPKDSHYVPGRVINIVI